MAGGNLRWDQRPTVRRQEGKEMCMRVEAEEELINKKNDHLCALIVLLSLIVWIFVAVRRICAFSLVMQTCFSSPLHVLFLTILLYTYTISFSSFY